MLAFLRNPEIKKMLLLHGLLFIVLLIFCVAFKPGYFYVCLILSLFWNILFLIFQYRRYKKLVSLNMHLDQILFSQKMMSLDEYKEGELSILSTNIEKLLLQLQDKQNLLLKDKQYLADSLADISHQFRTPLATLQLLIKNFQKEEDPQIKQNLLHKIYRNLDRMNRLIENLLILSKLDAGTLKMNRKAIPVKELLQKTISSLEINLELKNINLRIKPAGTLFCDEFWMTEALINLVKNSIEHTPENGQININCIQNPLYTEILIEDTGTGFSEKDLPYIFERFYRGENANPNSIGIGLALAKQIIHANYGEIKAGNYQQGAYFQIRFYQQII